MNKDTGTVKLQTSVTSATREFLRLESLRRQVTMGQLLDELIQPLCAAIPESTT
jgi:hypothetical protein